MRASLPITRSQTAGLVTRLREQTIPRLTADFARRKLAEVQARQGPPYKTLVDGRQGAPIDGVRPFGQIKFEWADLRPAFEWIYAELVARSPVGPERGQLHYFEDHLVWVGGQRIIGGAIIDIGPHDRILIVNGRPYARRIEAGLSLRAPSGVYQIVSMEAERRFPSLRISFDYVSADEASLPDPSKSFYRYPSISISQPG